MSDAALPGDSADAILARIAMRITARRQAAADAQAAAGYTPELIEALITEASPAVTRRRQPYRGRIGAAVIERAQLSLFDLERHGHFTQLPLTPGSEFPSLLARLPIFVPGKRHSRKPLLDRDNALPFETPWGRGRKHGPPLTVYDEDTLLALGMLRQRRLNGRGARMPIPVADFARDGEGVRVHVLFTTLTEVEALFGNSKNGKSFESRLDSIKRLASTRIEFESQSDKFVQNGTVISMIDVAWQRWTEESVLYIQFSPVMAHWFENAYSYVDWTVRLNLTDTGKAIHRFLSSQHREYAIYVDKLRRTIGYPRDIKYFVRDLRETMARLIALGWLRTYALEGNGRSQAYKLITERVPPR